MTDKQKAEKGKVMPESVEKLIVDNMRLVDYVINRRYFNVERHVGKDDLRSAGYIGLVKAARDFDPERGVSFSTCAVKYIHRELFHYIRANLSMIHIPCYKYSQMDEQEFERYSVASLDRMGFGEQDFIGSLADDRQDFESYLTLKIDIEDAMKCLTPKQKEIILLVLSVKSMREAGEQVGVTKSRVQNIMADFRKELEHPEIRRRKQNRRNPYIKRSVKK